MNIAYTIAPGRGETNLLLADVADALSKDGLRLVGTVQIDTQREAEHDCDMDVKVLPDGPVIRISQSLGKESRGCKLDPAALEEAVGLAQSRLAEGADMLIVNKFGKHEAEGGRGFRGPIGDALGSGVPVLVGVNKLNAKAFEEFCGGEAVELPPELDAILAWARSLRSEQAAE